MAQKLISIGPVRIFYVFLPAVLISVDVPLVFLLLPLERITRRYQGVVAMIADRTAYDVRYGYRLLSGVAVISVSI